MTFMNPNDSISIHIFNFSQFSTHNDRYRSRKNRLTTHFFLNFFAFARTALRNYLHLDAIFRQHTSIFPFVSILIVATQMNYSDCHPLAMNIRRRCFSTAKVPKILDNCRMYDVLVVPVTK